MKILIGNYKGGVGKSFLSAHLFYLLTKRGEKVYAYDMDKQGCLAEWILGKDVTNKPGEYKVGEHTVGWGIKVKPEFPADAYCVIDTPPREDELGRIIKDVQPDVIVIPVTAKFSREGAIQTIKIARALVKKSPRIVLVVNNIRKSNIGYQLVKKARDFAQEQKVTIYPNFIRHSGWVLRAEEQGVCVSDTRSRGGAGRTSLMGELNLLLSFVIGEFPIIGEI